MKTRQWAWLAGLLLAGAAHAGEPAYSKAYNACMDRADGVTQGMVECMDGEIGRQDARLNRAYRQVSAALPATRRTLLQTVQRQWMRYRDANCGFYYDPDGGTMARVQAVDCKLQMTAERAGELEAMRPR
ncbi:lysozyme inhibitor LprI family protein [Crenobacter cavernae]|uniref:DUF1311 domain-containing protein n=1 Tax=Crenobacter cavernae TaxID=2290923 RepID=A0A345Y8Y2_9NEIS|nr:lysozyme inhibitor LprI family protein [Crenobacter cavernae]AXK40384.1 DUF1311 domain-containing protein [Crenobacter cavernae]